MGTYTSAGRGDNLSKSVNCIENSLHSWALKLQFETFY